LEERKRIARIGKRIHERENERQEVITARKGIRTDARAYEGQVRNSKRAAYIWVF
jgi:hypothetical protein